MSYMGVPEIVAQRLIAHNFAALQVKLDQMTLLEVVDRPEMTTPEFLSQMGGTLNLWAGITVVVGVELIKFNYLLIANAARKSENGTTIQESGKTQKGEVKKLADKEKKEEEESSTWDLWDTLYIISHCGFILEITAGDHIEIDRNTFYIKMSSSILMMVITTGMVVSSEMFLRK